MLIMAQVLISAALMILIWLIQLLHYPFFEFIDEKKFPEAMAFHQRRISYIVMPLMLVELGLTLTLMNFTIIGIVLSIWLSTFLLQIPLHNKLTLKKDSEAIRSLVNSNWIRTILWTVKFLIVTWAFPS